MQSASNGINANRDAEAFANISQSWFLSTDIKTFGIYRKKYIGFREALRFFYIHRVNVRYE